VRKRGHVRLRYRLAMDSYVSHEDFCQGAGMYRGRLMLRNMSRFAEELQVKGGEGDW
jgi:hypothetical protein